MKTIHRLIFLAMAIPAVLPDMSWNDGANYNGLPAITGKSDYGQAEKNGLPADRFEWIKSRVKKYSPDSWNLLMQYESLPSRAEALMTNGMASTSQKTTRTFEYLKGNSHSDLLASMETNVHEIAHAFYRQNVFRYARENRLKLSWDNAEGFIFVSPGKSFFISFPKKSLFPSSMLSRIIQADMRTYRFNTYIKGNTSTQSEGVIGLLNELHAYYLGSKYCFDMLEAYKEAEGSEETGLFEWVSNTQSSMSALYEFDFFMLEYLLYMQKKYPADYAALRSCRSFIDAYKTIRSSYYDLADRYIKLIHSEMDHLNSSRKAEVWLDDGKIWVRTAGSNTSRGTSVFSEDRDLLIPVIQSDRYDLVRRDIPGI